MKAPGWIEESRQGALCQTIHQQYWCIVNLLTVQLDLCLTKLILPRGSESECLQTTWVGYTSILRNQRALHCDSIPLPFKILHDLQNTSVCWTESRRGMIPLRCRGSLVNRKDVFKLFFKEFINCMTHESFSWWKPSRSKILTCTLSIYT